MKGALKLVVLVWILLIPLSASAATPNDYEEALKIRLSAAACLASYSNQNGNLVMELAKHEGWKIETFEKVEKHADIQFMLASIPQLKEGGNTYLLAVAGTESNQDLKVDLRVRKVYFAGATLEEFAANAARN